MTSRSRLLAQRRAMLTTECALQRITLIGQTHALGSGLDWMKCGGDIVSRLKNLPGWVSALLAGLLIVAPKRVVPWAKSALLLWQIWRAISGKTSTQ
jgi:hypothetical protein